MEMFDKVRVENIKFSIITLFSNTAGEGENKSTHYRR